MMRPFKPGHKNIKTNEFSKWMRHHWNQKRKRSVMRTQEIRHIRAEISTHKHLGKCIYLLFVRLAVIGFRQNYFYILLNFGDFWAKMSFFHYIINQKNFNKTLFPPVWMSVHVYLWSLNLLNHIPPETHLDFRKWLPQVWKPVYLHSSSAFGDSTSVCRPGARS